MIIEITGLPGHGKTLYAMAYVKEWAERENRQVFYSGIADLSLPWTEIEADKWYECPVGSIVVIDECQRVFRARSLGKDVPEHVSRLETHRHQGIDIVLITQDPLLTDSNVRRLVGKHLHVVRKFGMAKANVYEWAGVRDKPTTQKAKDDAIKHKWAYDKRAYAYYKSAEVHTVKAKIPIRVFVMFLLPVVMIALGYFAYQRFRSVGRPKVDPAISVAPPAKGKEAAQSSPVGAKSVDPVEDAKQFVAMNTPRLEGLPHTAPKYDELTKPDQAPVPVACISTSSRCQCYSQQGTRINVRDQQCRDIAEYGYFQDFDPQGRRQRVEQSARVLDRPDGRLPLSGADTTQRPYVASLVGADGYGVLGKRGEGVRVPDGQNASPSQAAAPDAPQPRVRPDSPWRAS